MDKLTPGQLRDIADTIMLAREDVLSGADIVRHQMATSLREEAARREAEAKELGQTNARAADAPRDAAVCNPTGEREGLGSAAADYQRIIDDFRKSPDSVVAELSAQLAKLIENRRGRVGAPTDDAAPFRLEVGREYARRDGTGPVKIVHEGDVAWPMRSASGVNYTRDGLVPGSRKRDPGDLVALWQAEAQAPQTDADDLLAELGRLHKFFVGKNAPKDAAAVKGAADRIEAQARTIKAFELEHGGRALSRAQLRAERDALKARVVHMRSAFGYIRSWIVDDDHLVKIIDEALAGDKTNG